nr:MAG TPA: hypothetical protein [Caudoviricetes sp.]
MKFLKNIYRYRVRSVLFRLNILYFALKLSC